LAAEVRVDLRELLSAAELRRADRFTQLALIAAREAVADARLSAAEFDLERVDVLVSSGIGGMASTVREHSRGQKRGFDRISPLYIPMTIANIAAGRIAIEHGLRGDCSCITTACASSTHALGEAARHIRHGYADAAVCGGAEATVIPMALGGFTSMQALHRGDDPRRASIPFDAERSGFVMGEGAGILVLEALEHAEARGARVYAEIAGFGASCDAYHITAPEPEGRGAIAAMTRALADAELAPEAIGYINAHGTSTPLNDRCEALAIAAVFGGESGAAAGGARGTETAATETSEATVDASAAGSAATGAGGAPAATRAATTLPPVSSTKSMTGHLLGAAGAVEALICALALRDDFLPPTINYRVFDPDCALDVIANSGRTADGLQAVLSNSLGFGGHNASLILTKGTG
jgi:3-oxoacyl-[acyl-carrier-protein] synthase II